MVNPGGSSCLGTIFQCESDICLSLTPFVCPCLFLYLTYGRRQLHRPMFLLVGKRHLTLWGYMYLYSQIGVWGYIVLYMLSLGKENIRSHVDPLLGVKGMIEIFSF